jgi:hypothetical protein
MKRISTIGLTMAAILVAAPAFAGGDGDNQRSERAREAGYEASLPLKAAEDAAAMRAEADKALAVARDADARAKAAEQAAKTVNETADRTSQKPLPK